MADKPDAGPLPSNPLWWFLGIIVALFVIWMFAGGPQRYEANHPEIVPPTAAEIGAPTQ